MGAWGYKTFEDDSSLDLLDEWIESTSPIEDIRQALAKALSQEEFDFDAGQIATTAAAVLEFALSPSTAPDLEEESETVDELADWLLTLDQVKLLDLLPMATSALARLVSEDSELNDLWSENEELYPQWLDFNNSRRSRLQAISQPIV